LQHEHHQAGLVLPSSEVIYGGVSTGRFSAQRTAAEFEKRTLRFLYAGYVNPDRGLHTIIEALGLLPHDERERVELSVAQTGPPIPGEYISQVKKRIESLGLSKTVSFLGKIRHDDMARVYRTHHVLISATTRPEGLPMTMMEAMCAGCAVITTGSGGAIEIADIADLPIFPKDHPVALSRLIAKLMRDRKLVFKIAMRGQRVVLREFSFTRMAERICNTFRMICEQGEKQTKAHVPLPVSQVTEIPRLRIDI
jgi:glycosyltransferase involved in cell wall biosynthesis